MTESANGKPARADDGAAAPADPGRASLLGLVDRLAGFLEHSELSELEIEVGGTSLLMRKPVAAAVTGDPATGSAAPAAESTTSDVAPAEAPAEQPARASVKAPLTGLFYASPTPGSAPYVQVGGEVAVGQVIGLIEAMKLFNEIKSDLAGRVVRIVAEHGALVRAKQPLIEVDPL
jgi:acetyl-CoA carboxylase biotin carboxyl carrier protein